MTLEEVLTGELSPGRYRLSAPVAVRALRDEVAAAGWIMCIVDGAAVTDRDSLLAGFASACDFPDWFGHNWDALVDCLRDLSWLPDRPIAVFWQLSGVLAASDRATWRLAGEVIDKAIADRVTAGLPPLYVIYPATLSAAGGPGLQRVR